MVHEDCDPFVIQELHEVILYLLVPLLNEVVDVAFLRSFEFEFKVHEVEIRFAIFDFEGYLDLSGELFVHVP